MILYDCINLTDLDLSVPNKEQFIQYLKSNFDFKNVAVGSYLCPQYFMAHSVEYLQELKTLFCNWDVQLRLVVPVSNQTYLDSIKQLLKEMVSCLGTYTDYVVNDYGMLWYLNKLGCKNIIPGRLFQKEARDFRVPELLDESKKFGDVFVYDDEFINNLNIKAMEFDYTRSKYPALNNHNYKLIMHYPYTFLTTGNICEYASIGKPMHMKFRPSDGCHRQCQNLLNYYKYDNGQYCIKIGKGVYFKQPDPVHTDIEKEFIITYSPYNELYSYLRGK